MWAPRAATTAPPTCPRPRSRPKRWSHRHKGRFSERHPFLTSKQQFVPSGKLTGDVSADVVCEPSKPCVLLDFSNSVGLNVLRCMHSVARLCSASPATHTQRSKCGARCHFLAPAWTKIAEIGIFGAIFDKNALLPGRQLQETPGRSTASCGDHAGTDRMHSQNHRLPQFLSTAARIFGIG